MLALALALGLALLAGPAWAQTAVRLVLDGSVEGPVAPFFLPRDKGYFAQEGLDVTIEEGASAIDPIRRVAAGSHDFGFADINMLIKYHDQNPTAPIQAVFMVYNKPPYSVVGRRSRGIASPSDLEGKKVGAPKLGATFGVWPLFAKLNGIDTNKVSIENVGIPVRTPMLAAGQLDAVLGYSFRVYVDLKERGVVPDDIVLMPMADYGLKLYGSAVMVNTKFAAENPQATRAFLRGVLKGIKESIRSPSAAVNSVLKREDLARKDVELERLRMVIKNNILTEEVLDRGLGGVDPARFDQGLAQLTLTYPFRNKPKLDDVFNGAFLPPAEARVVNTAR